MFNQTNVAFNRKNLQRTFRLIVYSEDRFKNSLMAIERKNTFFVVSVIFSFITFYAQYRPTVIHFPLDSRIANALVSFVTYLGKTFRPHDLAVIYPFVEQIPFGQVMGAVLLIIVISAAVIVTAKKSPCLLLERSNLSETGLCRSLL